MHICINILCNNGLEEGEGGIIIEGKNLEYKMLCNSEWIMRPKNLSKLSVSTVIRPKCTKWLIVMDTNILGGQESENETNNFGRCTLRTPC